MAINTGLGFNVAGKEPIDSRITVANAAARKGLLSGQAYEGLIVYEQDTDDVYILINDADPSLDASWKPVVTGTITPGSGTDVSVKSNLQTAIDIVDDNTNTSSNRGVTWALTSGGDLSGSVDVSGLGGPSSDTLQDLSADGTTANEGMIAKVNASGNWALASDDTDDGNILTTGTSLPLTDGTVGELFYLSATSTVDDGIYIRTANSQSQSDWSLIASTGEIKAATTTLPELTSGTIGELFYLSTGDSSTPAGLYRRHANVGEVGDWTLIAQLDTDTTFSISENQDPMLDANGDVTNPHFQHLELTGSDSSVSRVHLGATQITAIQGTTAAQGAFIVLARDNQAFTNATHIIGASLEMVHIIDQHGVPVEHDSEFLDWGVLEGGMLGLNSTGLSARFDDTYRKAEVQNWVEHSIPVISKPAIQYYEVLGNPNFDAAAPVGTVDAEKVEFSEFAVDLSLQRRTGAVSDYHSKAISFSLTEAQATANAGHWTISVGTQGHVFVIKDDVYKEFRLNDLEFDRADPLLTCVAFDPLSIPSVAHDEQFVRVGAQQGFVYSFKLSELNRTPIGEDRVIHPTISYTQFPNEAITAIATRTHFDGNGDNVHTLAFGTSQGHLSYVSQFINDLSAVDEYIIDFDARDPLLPIPFDLRFPPASHAIQAYPSGVAKDGVYVREIKWIGQEAEFIAVGDHQAATPRSFVAPGDALGAPLVAYFRDIQATSSLIDGSIYYLTTPFEEKFFDNVVGRRDESGVFVSRALSAEAPGGTENDGSNLVTLNQLFGTAFTSVIPITIGSQDWVYFFGKRDIHVNNQYSSSRAFCIKTRLDGGFGIVDALNVFDADGQPIEGQIEWELVNVLSEVTGWEGNNSFDLKPLNHAQQRFNVQGGNNFIGLLDEGIIDIFGEGLIVVDLNANTDTLTYSQDAEDDLNHTTNGWAQTDVIWGGWIGNVGNNINQNLEYQTLTIMGQSGNGGTTPLYGISRYVVDISLILRPLNGDPTITVGPIRVPDATGTKLVDNVLDQLVAAYASSATTGKIAGETISISGFDEDYRVGSVEFASTRDFDISLVAHDVKQVVNVDNDTYEFTLKYAQRFVAGEGDLEYELRYPRHVDTTNADYPTIADEVTLFQPDGTTELDKGLYSISVELDTDGNLTRLNINLTSDGSPLPEGTIVAIDYGYISPVFYDFAHEVATSVDIMDQYYPGHVGSFQIPLSMNFADAGALTAYLVTKFTEVLNENEVEIIQEGNSNIIEFRTKLRGDATTDLILDDDQKFVIDIHNPVDVANPQVQGNLNVPRLFDGRSDFPGKFASTFDFNDAITEVDFRSVLHQVFAQTGSASNLNVPVITSSGEEVLNAANQSLYDADRVITQSYIGEQVISKHVAGTESSAFTGSMDIENGTTVNATGTTWDFTGADLVGFSNHINVIQDEYTYPFNHNVTYRIDQPTAGSSEIVFNTHSDFIEFLTDLGFPTQSGGTIQRALNTDVTYTIGGSLGSSFTVPSGTLYLYNDPSDTGNRTIEIEDAGAIVNAPLGNVSGLLSFTIPGFERGVTTLSPGENMSFSISGDTATIAGRNNVQVVSSIAAGTTYEIPNNTFLVVSDLASNPQRHYLLYNSSGGTHIVDHTAGVAPLLGFSIVSQVQGGTNPLILVESDLPNFPKGIADDTHQDYILRVTDVGGGETATWEQASALGEANQELTTSAPITGAAAGDTGSFTIGINLSTGTTDNDTVATKGYVDDNSGASYLPDSIQDSPTGNTDYLLRINDNGSGVETPSWVVAPEITGQNLTSLNATTTGEIAQYDAGADEWVLSTRFAAPLISIGGTGSDATTGNADALGQAALTLVDTGVTAGTYANAEITIDSKGRVVSATAGTAGSNYDDQDAINAVSGNANVFTANQEIRVADDTDGADAFLSLNKRSISPEAGDDLGALKFLGDINSTGTVQNDYVYGVIGASIVDRGITPRGVLHINVADGSEATAGVDDSQIRITGKAAGGATINVASDTDLVVGGDLTVTGDVTNNGTLSVVDFIVPSGGTSNARFNAPTQINGLLTGSGVTNSWAALANARGIRGNLQGSGVSISQDTTGLYDIFSANTVVGRGEISIPSVSNVVTMTGEAQSINTFLAEAATLGFGNLTDGTDYSTAVAPILLTGNIVRSFSLTADPDFLFSTSTEGNGNFIANWSETQSISALGNPTNTSFEQVTNGDNLFVYQDNNTWAVFEVDSFGTISGSTDIYINVTHVDSLGTPTTFFSGVTNKDTRLVFSKRSIQENSGVFSYTGEYIFDSAEGIRYRDADNILGVEAVFDLNSSGLTSDGVNLTSAGNLNSSPVNTMSYLAIQFNSTFVEILADNYFTDQVSGDTYIHYTSIYGSETAEVFVDHVDQNGLTVTRRFGTTLPDAGTVGFNDTTTAGTPPVTTDDYPVVPQS